MESNHPASEGSVQSAAGVCDAAASDDHQQVQSQQQAAGRSYECSFCKKGFSNAQALGGHMNIHRKDKAKLKQAAKDAVYRTPPDSARLLAVASSRMISNKGNNIIVNNKALEFTSSREILGGKKMSGKWGGNQEVSSFPRLRNESQMAEEERILQQLPLFVEKTANSYSKPPPPGQQVNISANWQEQIFHSTIGSGNGNGNGNGSGSSLTADLDLELRLGLSPSPESTVTGSFLKFF